MILRVPLEDLRTQTVVSLLNDLGCSLKFPAVQLSKAGTADEFNKEQEKFNKDFKNLLENFKIKSEEWLKDNGYLIEG